jgi:hypothetical protein
MNPAPSKPNRWRPITVFNLLVGLFFSLTALAQPDGLVTFLDFSGGFEDRGNSGNKIISNTSTELTTDRFGNPSSALKLKSLNSYITHTTINHPQKNEPRTYSVWVLKTADWKRDSAGDGWGPILSNVGEWQKGQPWLEAYENKLGSHIRFVGDVKTNPDAYIDCPIPWNYESWQNIIVTYRSPLLKIYINGILKTTKNVPALSSVITQPLMIGNLGNPFPGVIDDVRVYNKDLTSVEIQDLYNFEKPPDGPIISKGPQDQTIKVGGQAEFCVTIVDNRDYRFQWQRNFTNIPGETNRCYSLANVDQSMDGRRFRVVVSNNSGVVFSESSYLAVTPVPPPSITLQPVSQAVQENGNVRLSINAIGEGNIVYQWQLNEQNLPGATSATLNLNGVKLNTAGRYRVLVSSQYGVTISDTVTLTVNANPPPTIVTQPLSRAPAEGTQVSLTVTATGLGALTYQWQINNQNIPGATSSTLVLSAVRPSANGKYRVIVGNPYGTTISTEATVTVVVTDADSDGLSDYEELLLGTNSNKADSDGDGLSDFAELRTHGSNPLTTDTDGDGYSDGIEVARDGNPNNRSVTPTGALAVFPAVDVEFYTLNSVKYQLEVSTDMAVWTAQGGVVVGNGGSQNHLVRASKATQFWRLKVVQ